MTKLPKPNRASNMSYRVLGATSAIAISMALASPAFAQTVTSAADGETIALNTPITVADNPVVVVANNNVTVDNNTTISTTGVTQTVQVNAGTTGTVIDNDVAGIIEADSRVINIDGLNTIVNNAGTILGTGNQRNGTIYGNRTSNDVVINNLDSGSIDAGLGNDGAGISIEVGGGGNPITGSITNGGLIQGRGQADATGGTAGDGIRFFGPGLAPVYQYNGTITNTGTIASESAVGATAGVRFADRINFGGTLTNEAGGTISGVNNGVYFGDANHTGGEVINNGTVSSDSRAFNLDGTGLSVTNNGDIVGTDNQRNGTFYADGTADDFAVTNAGRIDAGDGNSGSGLGVEIGGAVDGANTFVLDNSGTIQGRGNADAATNAAGDGIRIGNVGNIGVAEATITNTGTIASEGANGTVAGVRFVNGISFDGVFDNSGTITGVQNGVYFGNPVMGEGADHSNGVFNNLAGGVISSDSRAFNIDGIGLTLNNAGTILGTGNQRNGTVYSDGTATDFTVNNTGTIDAGEMLDGSGFAAEIDTNGNQFTFVNDGDIIGRGQGAFSDGFRVGNGGNIGVATVDITNTGTISSESIGSGAVSGLRFVNGVSFAGEINNSGTIIGAQNGVYFGNPVMGEGADHSNGVFNNLAGGVISSDSRAFNIDGLGLTVNNAGSILGTGNQRNGTVYADGTADNFSFNNQLGGVIDAGAGNTGSGFGAEIGGAVDGANTFSLVNDGTIQGRGNADAATNAAGDGIRIGNVGNIGIADIQLTNRGTIASEGANGTVAGLRFVNGISFAGEVNNFGTISGTQNGVYFGNPVMGAGADHSNGLFSNFEGAVISSDSRAFNIDGLGLTLGNAGSILGTGNQRNGTVYADGTADNFSVLNLATGLIDAGEGNTGSGFGVEIGGAADGAITFALGNEGTIQGRGNADAATNAAGDGVRIGNVGNTGIAEATIINAGTIASEGANGTVAGVRIVNGVSLVGGFQNSGTISGVQNGVYFGNAVMGVGGDHSNAVFNNIDGGVISSDSRAFNIDGLGLTVNNAGTILGTGNQRNGTVYADATADQFTFDNSGTVTLADGASGSGVSLQLGSDAADLRNISITNRGTINGRGEALPSGQTAGLRLFGPATVSGDIENSGTISSEQSAAILIEGVNYTGTITNSGTLSGTSVLDASAAAGSVTFNQIGGAFNADFVGSSFDDTLSVSGNAFALAGDILGGVSTDFDAETTVTVSGARSLEGDLQVGGGLVFGLGVDSLAVDGDLTLENGSTVTIETGDVSNITLNAPITVIDQTGAFNNNGVAVNLIDDDFLVDYQVALESVSVTATAAALDNVSQDANVAALATAISTSFGAGQLDSGAANALNGSANAVAFEASALTLLPNLNEAVGRETWEAHSQSGELITQRIEDDQSAGAWIQGQLRSADRDGESLSVNGYEADTTGFALGYDFQVTDSLRLGASYSYADTDIDNDGAAAEEVELSTSQIAGYVGYRSDNIFASGQIGYIFGDAETSRTSASGLVQGDFDVDGFTAQAFVGREFGSIAPHVGVRYGSISQDAYTELGGLGATVDADDADFFEGVLGASFATTWSETDDWTVRPNLSADYVYDFDGGDRDVTVTLPGSTAQTLGGASSAQSRFELGAGLDFVNKSGWAIGVSYQGEFASDYTSNAGLLRARYAF